MTGEDEHEKTAPVITHPLSPGERPTLKTISRITGLAIATVSRALSDAPDISVETKRRVRECADHIGYQPNRAGQRLRTGKTHVVSLLMPTEPDIMSHTAQLISSIAEGLQGTAYHLVVTPYAPNEDLMRPLRHMIGTGSADAVILNQTMPEDPRVAYLMERGFPFATHGRTIWADQHAWFDFDNRRFAELGIAALARRGRRHVLIVAPPLDQLYGQDILEGITKACQIHGMTPIWLKSATSDSASKVIETAVSAALKESPEIDAILCASPMSAITAIDAAERSGRVIGRDFDAFAKEATPLLTRFRREALTLHEDVAKAGKALARAVIQAIEQLQAAPLQGMDVPYYEDPLDLSRSQS
ncbi:LacI family transcriptional regulator [Celeribacter baekdonensis]|uniref:LacI family transcriptional regulator n=1 Tax=Celeribacter baekdonensis B30 TaxID=1208323 RepID=K2JAK2_9RHOB|nr:LacI family transcriptional regulator [Celeribacter baekdonensis]EKE71877.1 LacI family transcriptional regulator [Celeribacter baekdonensis B30]